MAYRGYKNLQEIAKKFQVALANKNFIEPLPFAVDKRFQKDIAYVLQKIDVHASEAAISEFLIAPILKEVWKNYDEFLLLWSHVALNVGDEFEGFPDYLFTKKSELGLVRDKPYLMVVEAKKDDFEGGWAQCLNAMLASQKINGNDKITLHGIVSNGDVWQFGKLVQRRFTREARSYTISDLEDLTSVLNAVFNLAKNQIIQT